MKNYVFVIAGLAFLCLAFAELETHAPTPYILREVGEIGDLNIPSDNPMTVEGVRLGQLLFYETLLSADGSYSCGSCHKQEFSFSDGLSRAVGYRGDTLERNTMTLVNLAWQSEFFWDGRVKSLEALIEVPVTDPREMGQDTARLVELLQDHPHYPRYFTDAFGTSRVTFSRISKAIAQFLRSIVSTGIYVPEEIMSYMEDHGSADSLNGGSDPITDQPNLSGMYVRLAELCGACHTSAVYGGIALNSNHLTPPGNLVKVPPLVNILMSAPYMHDGSLANMEDVGKHYAEHISVLKLKNRKSDEDPPAYNLHEFDLANLEYFFRYFTDSSLLRSSEYSDPKLQVDWSWPSSL